MYIVETMRPIRHILLLALLLIISNVKIVYAGDTDEGLDYLPHRVEGHKERMYGIILSSSRQDTKAGNDDIYNRNQYSEYNAIKKKPYLAAGLSFILPGVGQIYNREYLKAGLFGICYYSSACLYYHNLKDGDVNAPYYFVSLGVGVLNGCDAYLSSNMINKKQKLPPELIGKYNSKYDAPNPYLAGFLSLIPGMGHLYNGQVSKAVLYPFGMFITPCLTSSAISDLYEHSDLNLGEDAMGLYIGAIIYPVAILWALNIVDAYVTARDINDYLEGIDKTSLDNRYRLSIIPDKNTIYCCLTINY